MPAHRTWTDEDLVAAVRESYSMAEVIRRLGLRIGGGTYPGVRSHIDRLGLPTDHFLGQGWSRGRRMAATTPLVELLIDGRRVGTTYLKERLLEAGLLEEVCAECGIGPVWNGKPLVLHLEHRNGRRLDNRLENLCLLCPNCHTQTPTYCRSKSVKVRLVEEYARRESNP